MTTHQTLDEIAALGTTTLDGEQQQGGHRRMILGIAELIAYISSFTTLLPGDVILTGTPEGVGPMKPARRSASRSRASVS